MADKTPFENLLPQTPLLGHQWTQYLTYENRFQRANKIDLKLPTQNRTEGQALPRGGGVPRRGKMPGGLRPLLKNAKLIQKNRKPEENKVPNNSWIHNQGPCKNPSIHFVPVPHILLLT